MDSKVCPRCKTTKQMSEFRKRSKDSKYFASWCRSCESEYMTARYKVQREKWKKENPNKVLGYSRKWKRKNRNNCYYYNAIMARGFNLTVDEYAKLYDTLYQEQKGCCAICGKHQSEFNARLGVDHSHENGQIRGLLCNSCNLGIGSLQDSVECCLAAAEYLRRFKASK